MVGADAPEHTSQALSPCSPKNNLQNRTCRPLLLCCRNYSGLHTAFNEGTHNALSGTLRAQAVLAARSGAMQLRISGADSPVRRCQLVSGRTHLSRIRGRTYPPLPCCRRHSWQHTALRTWNAW